MSQLQGHYNLSMQQRAQAINGVGDDGNMDKKTLMHQAIANNGRKVSRPGQQPMPMPPNQVPTPAQQSHMMALKQQQAQSQVATIQTFTDLARE